MGKSGKAGSSKAGSEASEMSSQAASGTSSWPAQTAIENCGGYRPACYPRVVAPETGRDGPTIISSTLSTAQPVARYPSSRALADLREELSSVKGERDSPPPNSIWQDIVEMDTEGQRQNEREGELRNRWLNCGTVGWIVEPLAELWNRWLNCGS